MVRARNCLLGLLLGVSVIGMTAASSVGSSERTNINFEKKFGLENAGNVNLWKGNYILRNNKYYWNYSTLNLNLRERGVYHIDDHPTLYGYDTGNVTVKIPMNSIVASSKGYSTTVLNKEDAFSSMFFRINIECITENSNSGGHSYFKINVTGFCISGDFTDNGSFTYYINYFDVS